MNLTYFRPEMRGNVEKEPSQHQICRQNIRRRKFIWEHHTWYHDKISEVTTLVLMIPNFWCSLEAAATELHLCFVIKGNVWWKRTFPMATIVVLHHSTWSYSSHLHHMLLRGPSEKVLISRFDSRNQWCHS